MRTVLTFLTALTLASLATGCKSRAAEFCDALCDCERCNDREYDECKIDAEAAQDTASAYGCDDDYDTRHECIMKRASCLKGIYDRAVLDCASDYANLVDCENRASDIH
jgi:hypothetical protein